VSRRPYQLLFWIGLAIAPPCLAEDLCPLLKEKQGFAPQAIPEAYAFLESVGKLLGTPTGIRLFPSANALVKNRAAAQMCGPAANQRWIFYDESYLNSLPPNGQRFILAHEAAHHISGDTLLGDPWTNEIELSADYSAAVWLARLGLTIDQLLQAFDALRFAVEPVGGYPTRSERRAKVLQGYADATPKSQPVPTTPTATVKLNPKDGLKYVWIPPGTFTMGCSSGDNECYPNERPAHQVAIVID
jgi:hypothetical protein